MTFPNKHITDDDYSLPFPDRWKWEYAISYVGMEWNEYQLRLNGYRGDVGDYYRQYRFAMNTKTMGDIDYSLSTPGVAFLTGGDGLTVIISGIEIRVDDNLPDGRVVLIKGECCVSFDWCGRITSADEYCIPYRLMTKRIQELSDQTIVEGGADEPAQ